MLDGARKRIVTNASCHAPTAVQYYWTSDRIDTVSCGQQLAVTTMICQLRRVMLITASVAATLAGITLRTLMDVNTGNMMTSADWYGVRLHGQIIRGRVWDAYGPVMSTGLAGNRDWRLVASHGLFSWSSGDTLENMLWRSMERLASLFPVMAHDVATEHRKQFLYLLVNEGESAAIDYAGRVSDAFTATMRPTGTP